MQRRATWWTVLAIALAGGSASACAGGDPISPSASSVVRLRKALLALLLTPVAFAGAEAQGREATESLHARSQALATALRARQRELRGITQVDACSVFEVLDRQVDFRMLLPPDVRKLINPESVDSCPAESAQVTRIEVLAIRVQPDVVSVVLRTPPEPARGGEVSYETYSVDPRMWVMSKMEIRCCTLVQGTDFPRDPSSPGVIIDYKRPISGPSLILNGRLLQAVERDSVLATLRTVTLDSIRVYPAGETTMRQFGSRAAHGVVMIWAREKN